MSETFEGWAIVEIMGHRRVAGYVREVTLFGSAMCRVDVPFHDKDGWQLTQMYGGASIFCVTPTTEERCKELAPRPLDLVPYAPEAFAPELTESAGDDGALDDEVEP